MRQFLYWQIRLLLRPFLAPWVPLGLQRFWSKVAALSTKGPPGFCIEELGGGLHKLTTSASSPDRAVLYLHGGAFVLGGLGSHAKLAGQIAHAGGATAYFCDYRLAPEHPYPAALDDALAACRWLLDQGMKNIALAGDSAGGGLALAAALAIRDAKLPMPCALVLLSPFVDLALSGESHHTHKARDPMLRRAWLEFGAQCYAKGEPNNSPLISPLFGDLRGLPPILTHVGSEEILLSDSQRLAERTLAAGVKTQLKVFEGMWHDFHAHAGALPESAQALEEVGEFLKQHLN